ncbi:HEAT repeat domain-containing protein [Candidatus Ozemobacteraceae bacterium]|nr:HEAT repeat domain-containing protein [Candidatus Ozemobacteraceae bacterium]
MSIPAAMQESTDRDKLRSARYSMLTRTTPMAKIQLEHLLSRLRPLLATLITGFRVGEYRLRREAAIALSKFKCERATNFLLENFESDNIQDFMALALGNIESSRAISLLMQALNDSQQEVRFNAAQALGMIKSPEAFNVLMESLNEYADTNISGGTATSGGGRIFFEEEAIISAINALGKIKNNLSTPLLKRILAQDKSPRIRASIIMALGMMSNDRMLPIFQAALRDEDSRVRANAIEAIEGLKSSSIVGIIQPYLDDPNNRVRANVAKAIWKFGDFDVSDTLNQMLTHADKLYRASAAYALGEIRDVRFIPKLAMALRDDDADVRRNAANALKKLQSPDAVKLLTPLMDDPNYDVRVQVVQAIVRCSPASIPDLLVPRLEREENPIVKATLISCIAETSDTLYCDLLFKFLDDPDSRVVSNTIEALQKLNASAPPQKLIGLLKRLLSHEDNRIKTNAIRALWSWNEHSVLDNLHQLLHHSELRHRQSAMYVLGEIGTALSNDSSVTTSVNTLIAELLEPGVAESAAAAPAQPAEHPAPEAPPATLPVKPAPAAGPASAPPQPEPPAPEPPAETFDQELEQAANAVNAREFEQALAIYTSIIEAQPENFKAILGLANLHYIRKNFADAAPLYEKALAQQPNLVKAHYNLGTIAYFQKDFQKARDHLVQALTLYPKLLGAYLILAQIFQFGGRTEESIKLLTKAVELSPRNPVLFQKLAMLHLHARNFDKATDVLTRAISLSPLDIESNLLLAYCLQATSRSAEAFKAFDATLRACAQSPSQDESLKALMQSYLFVKSTLKES